MKHILPDNGGRRMAVDQRQFSYDIHIPDRNRDPNPLRLRPHHPLRHRGGP